MAWREKVTICFIVFLLCSGLMFLIVGLGRFICPRLAVLSPFELSQSINDPWVYAYGRAYQIKELVEMHDKTYGVAKYQFEAVAGGDVSQLFYKNLQFETYCPGLAAPQATWDNIAKRNAPDSTFFPHRANDLTTGVQKPYLEFMARYAKARIAWNFETISKISNRQRNLIVIAGNVYDVTAYFTAQTQFLGPLMQQLFTDFQGKDATQAWTQIARSDADAGAYLQCMNNMFYIGVIDTRQDFKCQLSNYLLLSLSILLVTVIGFKFLAALQIGSMRAPENHDRYVICQVPCYTEGPESLTKTLDSIAAADYATNRKLLVVLCDGLITGSGNDRTTPQIVLDILGNDSTNVPEAYAFESLGEGLAQQNRARIYHGIYEHAGNLTPYIVVVKVGREIEKLKPGNRGKRDSQLILMRFLSRIHFRANMSPMELQLLKIIKSLDMHPRDFEFLLTVDADTVILPDSINKLMSVMVHDSKIAGLCGETLISNPNESWVTMIQVYEYFVSHHISKSFESLFGAVTCLPGCFCLYRIRSSKTNAPILISPVLVKAYAINRVDTLHLKNLLQLGEDRYLTTLLLKHFPGYKTKFDIQAKCYTVVPDQWDVLLSQRRRWINSTVHNLVELLSLEQLCGCCCFSMRFIVLMDLFSTLVQPSGILYIGYLVYSIVATTEVFPVVSLVILCAIYGLQVFIFCLKQEWSQIGWMVIFQII